MLKTLHDTNRADLEQAAGILRIAGLAPLILAPLPLLRLSWRSVQVKKLVNRAEPSWVNPRWANALNKMAAAALMAAAAQDPNPHGHDDQPCPGVLAVTFCCGHKGRNVVDPERLRIVY